MLPGGGGGPPPSSAAPRPEGGPMSRALPTSAPPRYVSGTDASAGYGTARADAFKQTPAYQQAVKQVFLAQPIAQKVAIVKGLSRNKGPVTPEGLGVFQAFKELAPNERQVLSQYMKANQSGPDFFGMVGHFFSSGIKNMLTAEGVPNTLPGAKHGGPIGNPGGASILGTMFGGKQGAAQILKGAANDAINLPGNTVQGLYGLGKDVTHGKFGAALHMLIDPYIHAAQNPGDAFMNHPLNTAMLVGGPETILGRGAGAIARSGVLGDAAKAAAGTAREPLALGMVGDAKAPFVEHRSYSPNVLTKAAQVAWENHLRKKGLDPNVARPAPGWLPQSVAQATNTGVEAKLRRFGGDEPVAVRQMQGREARARMAHTVAALAPDKQVRNIVPHILQSVVRTPNTAVADLLKEADRIKAAQTGSRTVKTVAARNQIRDLLQAAKHPELLPQAFDTAATLRSMLHEHDKVLVQKGLLDPEQAQRSRLFPYAQAHMGARFDHKAGALAHPDGSPLSTSEILQHLKDNKVPDPAYVGHYPAKGASWQFYQRYHLARGTKGGQARTGEAFRTGNYDHTYQGLVGQAARAAETVTKAQLHDKIVNQFGILKPSVKVENGRMVQTGSRPFRNPDEARKYAYAALHDDHGNVIPGRLELVPISLAAKNSMDLVKDLQHPNEVAHQSSLELQAFQHAMDEAKKPGADNIALIPKIVADRIGEQFAKTGNRTLGKVTQQFRRTVLPYSTHWMMQIGAEAGLRSMVAGVLDPRNVVAGRQLMRELIRTEEGRAALQEMVNATFYGSHQSLGIHNPNANPLVAGAKAFPVTRAIIDAHNHYADGVGHAMYQLEHQFRLMGLGKLARQQLQEFTGSYQAGIRLQAENVALLAGKLRTDPALVARFGRQVDDIFGKYNKMSPKVRAMVQTATPFLPWYLNAAKFVLWQLPAKHPVASSLLASLRQTINQDVADGKAKPLNDFAEQEIARISPFGIFNPPQYPGAMGVAAQAAQTGASTILPQILSPLYSIAGVNSFGDAPLKGPKGDVKPGSPDATSTAIESGLETVLPGASKLREVLEGGKPSYGTSTIWNPEPKPGPSGGAGMVLNRIFNPFYSFERAMQSKGGGTARSGKVSLGASGLGAGAGSLGPAGLSYGAGALGAP